MDDLGDLGFISRGQGQNEIGPYNPQAERGGEAVNVVSFLHVRMPGRNSKSVFITQRNVVLVCNSWPISGLFFFSQNDTSTYCASLNKGSLLMPFGF